MGVRVCVSGMMRSGTTWLAGLIAEALGEEGFADEPCVIVRHFGRETVVLDAEFDAATAIGRGGAATWRLPGGTDPNRQALERAFDAIERHYPHAVQKMFRLPYWWYLRERWPNAKFVICFRGMLGWLSSVARLGPLAEAFAAREWGCPQAWLPLADRALERNPELNVAMARAAAYHQVVRPHMERLALEELGERVRVVRYEQAVTESHVVIPALLDWLGADDPGPKWLCERVRLSGRPWLSGGPGWRECVAAAEAVGGVYDGRAS